jgi:hypothetical protein
MALETNAHARVHDTFWHKSLPCPMTQKSSACVNYPWTTFGEAERAEKEGVTTRLINEAPGQSIVRSLSGNAQSTAARQTTLPLRPCSQ